MKILQAPIFTLSIICLLACSKKGQTSITPVAPVNPITQTGSLKDLPFKFGAAVNAGLLRSNANYKALIVKEYSSLTAENAMKFAATHPQENTYNYTDADEIVALAQANGKRVHGHTLIWHQSLPDWVINFNGDATAWENLFKTHIQTVVAHFKGKVTSWDVVNEVFNENGTYRTDNIWYQKLGPDFVARAFTYAHEADPNALLFYNDYGHEYGPTKRTAILNLVNNLKSRGIPIDGIGLQMHTSYEETDANIATAINTAAATGLLVHVSELDISMNKNNTYTVYSEDIGKLQQAKYKALVKVYNAIPKAQQFGITTWNVTDADSWLPAFYKRPEWPLPFNSLYERKLAYQGILDGVK